jgi:hypothetical protein
VSEEGGRWPRRRPDVAPTTGDRPASALEAAVAERREVIEALEAVASSASESDRSEVEELMTLGAAIVLHLEREQVRAKRRGRAALVRAETDASAAREAREMSASEARLAREIAALRRLMARARRRYAPGL